MFHTIIIGAGIAGLSAAKFIQEHSDDTFIILESADKIGGRVDTVEFDNKTFSKGPGWIHGKEGNPIFNIFNKLNIPIKLCDTDQHGLLFVWDTVEGKNISDLFIERREKLKEVIESVTETLFEKDEEINPDKTFKELLSEYSQHFEKLSDIDRTVLFTCFEIYLGAPLQEVSGYSEIQIDEIYESDEDMLNFRILDPLGATKFINYLAGNFKDQIKLNCKVNTIDWGFGDNKVAIIANDGEQFICKNVIVTVQSDLLNKQSIIFKPKLPDEKTDSWKHTPAVNYCRLFAKFPRKFWPNQEWLIPVLKDIDPTNELVFWQNAASQNLCSEDDNILICHYTSGSKNGKSRFDVEKEELIELVTESMKNMFPNDYCRPIDVLFVTHWGGDRFSGAFSIVSPGMNKSLIEQLKASVGPLHFAGESVLVEFIGTMQGAYMSGINAAKETLNDKF